MEFVFDSGNCSTDCVCKAIINALQRFVRASSLPDCHTFRTRITHRHFQHRFVLLMTPNTWPISTSYNIINVGTKFSEQRVHLAFPLRSVDPGYSV
jgi:hypothetical protein